MVTLQQELAALTAENAALRVERDELEGANLLNKNALRLALDREKELKQRLAAQPTAVGQDGCGGGAVVSEHTKEPWHLVADDGADFTAISTQPTLPEGKAIDHDHEVLGSSEWLRCKPADLRRIVACVNACAGIRTDALEAMPQPFSKLLSTDFHAVVEQRDQLRQAQPVVPERLEFRVGDTQWSERYVLGWNDCIDQMLKATPAAQEQEKGS